MSDNQIVCLNQSTGGQKVIKYNLGFFSEKYANVLLECSKILF